MRLSSTFLHLFALAGCLLPSIRADPPPYTEADAKKYDTGGFGIYPEIKYKSTDLVAPHVLKKRSDPRCANNQYIFLCPRGLMVPNAGPMILDNDGRMVWHSTAWPVAYGLTVQKYRGEDYLTFWSGNDQVIGHGSGNYFMLDKHYNQYKMISPIGEMTGDLHEFKISRDNTALITSYITLPWDLSAVGGTNESYIWECVFQEIDIETDTLLFEWRATDWFTFDDCYNPIRNSGEQHNPWDWFHINSIEKDKWGNYLISARYSHAVSYIDGKTGKPLWHLGGKKNSFNDITDKDLFVGGATDIAWQHDARWIIEGKSLSIFDNAAYFADQRLGARGIKVEFEFPKATAKLIAEAKNPVTYITESQGSAQVLKNQNMFLGYGSAAAMTEFSPNGSEVLCDWQYGALHYKDGKFTPSAVMSYRIYKAQWKGFPSEDPKVFFDEKSFFVSWNGATELKSWQIEGSNGFGSSPSDWEQIATFDRNGFESSTELDHKSWTVFRLTALDKQKKSLCAWIVYSGGEVHRIPLPERHIPGVFLVLLGAVLTIIVAAFCRRRIDILDRFGLRSTKGYLPVYNQANGSASHKRNPTEMEIPSNFSNPSIKEY